MCEQPRTECDCRAHEHLRAMELGPECVPILGVAGRVGAHRDSALVAVLDTETGQLRLDSRANPEFWLEITHPALRLLTPEVCRLAAAHAALDAEKEAEEDEKEAEEDEKEAEEDEAAAPKEEDKEDPSPTTSRHEAAGPSLYGTKPPRYEVPPKRRNPSRLASRRPRLLVAMLVCIAMIAAMLSMPCPACVQVAAGSTPLGGGALGVGVAEGAGVAITTTTPHCTAPTPCPAPTQPPTPEPFPTPDGFAPGGYYSANIGWRQFYLNTGEIYFYTDIARPGWLNCTALPAYQLAVYPCSVVCTTHTACTKPDASFWVFRDETQVVAGIPHSGWSLMLDDW